jgi:UDP-glucuronate 4-epimerase
MQVFNLGNSRTVNLNEFIDTIERVLEKKANIKPLPLQPGDVPRTFADLSKSRALLDYDPQVTIEEGLRSMAEWYIAKYGSKRNKE